MSLGFLLSVCQAVQNSAMLALRLLSEGSLKIPQYLKASLAERSMSTNSCSDCGIRYPAGNPEPAEYFRFYTHPELTGRLRALQSRKSDRVSCNQAGCLAGVPRRIRVRYVMTSCVKCSLLGNQAPLSDFEQMKCGSHLHFPFCLCSGIKHASAFARRILMLRMLVKHIILRTAD